MHPAGIRRRVAKNLHWATRGPNCVRGGSHATTIWTKFLQLKEEDKLYHLREIVQQEEGKEEEEFVDEEEQQTSWSWRKILESVFEDEVKNTREKVTKTSPLSCNLYDRKPDFKNCYGWSVDQDGSEYSPLKSSGVGIYHVNLSAVNMQANSIFLFDYSKIHHIYIYIYL